MSALNQPPTEKVTLKIQGRTVVLDPDNMKYNENTLGDYMNVEYGWIDYFGKQLEYAQKEMLLADIEADAVQAAKFLESKDSGNTEGYAKAYSISHVDVVAAKKHLADRKETVGHLKAHLRAWDKNHENVQNRGHTLRKELDKMSREIYPTSEDPATCSFEDILRS